MYYALLSVHILVCIVMIVSILMQAGRGGGLAGGAFGGAASGGGGQLFGGGGAATFLTKVTTYTAVFFFVTCIGLWYTARSGDSLPETAAEKMLQQQGSRIPLNQPALPLPFDDSAPTTTEGAAPASTDSTTNWKLGRSGGIGRHATLRA